MFRRPTELSSDSSSSSEDEGVNVPTDSAKATDGVEIGPTSLTQPLSADHNGGGVEPVPQEHNGLTPSEHSNMILVALLEELAHTRAAELLNTSTAGSSYHRNSPEAQRLAHTMFSTTSKTMAANGLIPPDLAGDDLRTERKAYIARLDKLGRHSLKDAGLNATGPMSSLGYDGQDRLLVVSRPEVIALPDWLPEADVRVAMNARAPFLSPSPFVDLQMSTRSFVNSRYRTDFQEIRCLGRGAFGQVYHVSIMMILDEYC